MDLLIRKTAGKRYEKRIFLVTDAGCSVNQDDLEVVCEQFLKIDARLNVMYVARLNFIRQRHTSHICSLWSGVGFEDADEDNDNSQDRKWGDMVLLSASSHPTYGNCVDGWSDFCACRGKISNSSERSQIE